MERLLYFLPTKPQPAWVRYATTTVLMVFCMAVQIGLARLSGFVGLFFLLPGIFAAGLMFDRGASLYATALGTAFADSEALRTGFRRKPDSVPMIADSR